jgi:hypothetical protein
MGAVSMVRPDSWAVGCGSTDGSTDGSDVGWGDGGAVVRVGWGSGDVDEQLHSSSTSKMMVGLHSRN